MVLGYFYSYLICTIAALIVMTLAFLIGRSIERYDFVDVAWGITFVIVTIVSFMVQPGHWLEFDGQVVASLLVVIWGVRLCRHIARRIAMTSEEDRRYVELSQKWRGNRALNMYFRVYFVQALLVVVILSPVIFINASVDDRVDSWVVGGLVLWLVGFIIEAEADRQLQRFQQRTTGSNMLMKKGLWKYARHPNYFGEIVQWWAIFIVALSLPSGWMTVVSPLAITFLILFISGVPPKERRLARKPGWKQYRQKTRLLIPLPRR